MIDLSRFDNSAFDRGASRLVEALWVIVKCLFFLHAVPLPSSWKVFWLRRFGARVGTDIVIRSRVNITFPWRVTIGSHVWIGDEVAILSLDRVTIGSHACLSQRAFLCTGSHDFDSHAFDLETRPIVVGDGCWVAAQAFVGPGVTLGEGSLCAAGAVVVRDVPPGGRVGGNPARELSRSST